MNKAFVKEPDSNAPALCPRCGSLGIAVAEATLRAHLPPDALRDVSPEAFFCSFPQCVVVYFDAYERTISVERMFKPVYPKDAEAPMCGCFGFTRESIEQDLHEGSVHRTRALLAKAKGPEARCTVMAASGQCCAGEVQRYYMKRRAELSQS
jgi:hypothetical protein